VRSMGRWRWGRVGGQRCRAVSVGTVEAAPLGIGLVMDGAAWAESGAGKGWEGLSCNGWGSRRIATVPGLLRACRQWVVSDWRRLVAPAVGAWSDSEAGAV